MIGAVMNRLPTRVTRVAIFVLIALLHVAALSMSHLLFKRLSAKPTSSAVTAYVFEATRSSDRPILVTPPPSLSPVTLDLDAFPPSSVNVSDYDRRIESPVDLTVSFSASKPQAREQDSVRVSVFVKPDGTVRQTRIERSSGRPELDDAARHYAMRLHLTPDQRDRTTQGAWVSIILFFDAHGSFLRFQGPSERS